MAKYFLFLFFCIAVVQFSSAKISTVITGTRTGIGFELVKQLSKLDNSLVIATHRDISKAKELKELADAHENIKLLNLDVTAFDTFDNFTEEVKRIVGDEGLSSVIHNAGISRGDASAGIEAVEAKDVVDMYMTNTVGPIMLTKALLPLIKAKAKAKASLPLGYEKGSIFFISSELGSHTNNKMGKFWGYRESKSAVNQAMLSLKAELGTYSIGAMSLHPGWVQTNVGGKQAPLTPEQSVQGLVKLITAFSDKTNGAFYKFDGTPLPW